MSVHLFAVRIETFRLVAAEIHDRAAAALLDAGQPILLGTVEELGKLAARLRRPLLTISRAPTRSAPRRNAVPTGAFRPQPSPASSGARTRTAQAEELYPVSAPPADDCRPCVPAVRVA